jgi:hypothetical protein
MIGTYAALAKLVLAAAGAIFIASLFGIDLAGIVFDSITNWLGLSL